MPIPPPGFVTQPGTYDLIVTMQNNLNTAIKWRNTYTFTAPAVPSAVSPIVTGLTRYTQAMCPVNATVVSAACYNWARGRQPYPLGQPVFTEVLNQAGTTAGDWGYTIQAGSYYMAGEVAMRIDHIPALGGRPGRNFFRSMIMDVQLNALVGGSWTLEQPTPFTQTQLQNIIVMAGLVPFFAPGAAVEKLVIVRFSPKTGVVHGSSQVESFGLVGVTTTKINRKNKK